MDNVELMTVEQLKQTIANLKLEAEQREARQAECNAKQSKQYDDLQRIGNCAMDSIREMVAALECDYDRLEELRSDRDAYEIEDADANTSPDGPCYANNREAWAGENPGSSLAVTLRL